MWWMIKIDWLIGYAVSPKSHCAVFKRTHFVTVAEKWTKHEMKEKPWKPTGVGDEQCEAN
jgi:hypothetical protein